VITRAIGAGAHSGTFNLSAHDNTVNAHKNTVWALVRVRERRVGRVGDRGNSPLSITQIPQVLAGVG
jgi:hypothetical protein